MVEPVFSLPSKWTQFLKNLAEEHDIDLNTTIDELFEWALTNDEDREQFKDWLDEAYPPPGEAEEETMAAGEEAAEEEDENEEKAEEEHHEHW